MQEKDRIFQWVQTSTASCFSFSSDSDFSIQITLFIAITTFLFA